MNEIQNFKAALKTYKLVELKFTLQDVHASVLIITDIIFQQVPCAIFMTEINQKI